METRVYYKATPEDIAEAFLMKDREIEALRAENERLQQVSALTCDKCGWAMQFPGEECRNCGYEALRAENARLYEWKDKAGDMDRVKTVELVDLRAENARLREALKPFDRECKRLVANYHRPETQMRPAITAGELRAARAAMGESDE